MVGVVAEEVFRRLPQATSQVRRRVTEYSGGVGPDAAEGSLSPSWPSTPSAEAEAPVRISAWTAPRFFDAAGGLPPSPEAEEWLAAGWRNAWADPVGRHTAAARARAIVAESRARFGQFLGCSPAEIWFAPNADIALATAATALAASAGGPSLPVLVSPLERLSVLRTIDRLAPGRAVRQLPITPDGRVDIHSPALAEPAQLIVVQAANREIGTRQPLPEIAAAQSGAALLRCCWRASTQPRG